MVAAILLVMVATCALADEKKKEEKKKPETFSAVAYAQSTGLAGKPVQLTLYVEANYPFSIVSFDLNAKGEGQGTLLVATKIKFTKDNQIELEHYGSSPMRLASVKQVK